MFGKICPFMSNHKKKVECVSNCTFYVGEMPFGCCAILHHVANVSRKVQVSQVDITPTETQNKER